MRMAANTAFRFFVMACLVLGDARGAAAQGRQVAPILGFPEAGLDDPAAYQGYQTRFFRDTQGNVVQIYLDSRTGRVVNLIADAVDESVGFTVRDASGNPAALSWGSQTARIDSDSRTIATRGARVIEYQLTANSPRVEIGWLLLGSMRVERDLQYSDRHKAPFGSPTFRLQDVEDLVANIEKLPDGERTRDLLLLRARDAADLRSRLEPTIGVIGGPRGQVRGVAARQASLDNITHLSLEILVDPAGATETLSSPTIKIQSKTGGPVSFTVRVTTDGPSLTPLARTEIFTPAFLRFLADARARASAGAGNAGAGKASSYYRLLERDVRGTELLSSREKLMAGLPNYATYFGRDMMMTSLMMEPVWQDAMFENVIASALRKLGPLGDVSHEEALGGQAIRENAGEYNAHIANYFRLAATDRANADTALAAARAILTDLQRVRENYHMRDDEFQLPIIVARYLRNPNVAVARKKAFLADASSGHGSRLTLLMRELGLVAELAAPYARNPIAQNLIGSPKQDATQWRSISWRDSNAGYANGRFAMDINAIWAPRALRSIAEILSSLRQLGFAPRELVDITRPGGALTQLARDASFSQRAIRNWDGAIRHFIVVLSPDQVRTGIQAKLASLPAEERAYWQSVLQSTEADRRPLEFTALSLDENGRPIPVVNTDPATWLFLHDAKDSTTAESRARALRDVRAIVRNYPAGLFIDRLGPVVANDAYASPSVWQAFERDRYHSPRVVWGREVNLIMLGLSKQIAAATDASGQSRSASLAPFVSEMREALRRVNTAVEASGLKHNELWSYEISGGSLHPIRYGASTDVQLWNVTDLAVQYTLWTMRR